MPGITNAAFSNIQHMYSFCDLTNSTCTRFARRQPWSVLPCPGCWAHQVGSLSVVLQARSTFMPLHYQRACTDSWGLPADCRPAGAATAAWGCVRCCQVFLLWCGGQHHELHGAGQGWWHTGVHTGDYGL